MKVLTEVPEQRVHLVQELNALDERIKAAQARVNKAKSELGTAETELTAMATDRVNLLDRLKKVL